ncbi:MAG: (d)CMP kinase [Herpetosiphonaceae bacterium]|nr:(d)CMP kinase [Herpetosiphonaceae bacterium]
MQLPSVITIDGPAAAGKSTLGYLLAQRLGYTYFDTGVLYRAITCLALRRGTSPDDEEALTKLAQTAQLQVLPPTVADGRQYTVLANDIDITSGLREVTVDRNVSTISSYPAVRTALREQQRRIGAQGQVVMVGRDIGTVVMPKADLKVFLHASVEARAARRHADVLERGEALPSVTVEADLVRRDALDASNTFRPQDALVLDTDHLTPEQEIEAILQHIETRLWGPTHRVER